MRRREPRLPSACWVTYRHQRLPQGLTQPAQFNIRVALSLEASDATTNRAIFGHPLTRHTASSYSGPGWTEGTTLATGWSSRASGCGAWFLHTIHASWDSDS